MNLQNQLKSDLKLAMKTRDDDKLQTVRIIMGEMSRKSKKEFEDDEIISIIKKLIVSEKELLSKQKKESSKYLEICQSYLPSLISEDEIKNWINENIDFSSLKNKMQAISLVTKEFGSKVDGNVVKNIIQNNY